MSKKKRARAQQERIDKFIRKLAKEVTIAHPVDGLAPHGYSTGFLMTCREVGLGKLIEKQESERYIHEEYSMGFFAPITEAEDDAMRKSNRCEEKDMMQFLTEPPFGTKGKP